MRFTLIFMLLLALSPAWAQHTSLSKAQFLGVTPRLDELPNQPYPSSKVKKSEKVPVEMANFSRNVPMPTPNAANALPKGEDPLRQKGFEKNNFLVEPNLVLEGPDQTLSEVFPPDPCGDASNDYYVAMVNASFISVYDKMGNLLEGPSSTADFWASIGANGFGDPIVLWDQFANRWLISELGNYLGGSAMLTAVSTTDDPLGSYNVYAFIAPMLPDYPKYAVWPNGYYVTTNEFFDYIPVYVFDRDAMIAGEPEIDVQRLEDIPKFNATDAFQVLTPADLDGPVAPPANSPAYMVRIHDDAWGGSLADELEVWAVTVDWDNPDNTLVEGPTIIPLAAFDSHLCDFDIFNCLEQPDGTLVSAIQHVIMYRVAYRNFGAHESMVLNFTVDVTGNNQTGVRWVELRRTPGNPWELFQEGTYAPDDQSRFMGSIAQDGGGNILLGYAVTGSEDLLSLRFTGRLAGDPLGEMTINEYELAEGLSINFNQRWGDYHSMVVDPTDDRTFWFFGEYMKADQWGTRIMTALIQRDSNDIGVASLAAPVSSGYLTNAEPVTAVIRNYGYLPQSNFQVSFSLDGSPLVTETVTDTIFPDGTLLHTFAPTVDLSVIGPYEFTVFTTLAADTLPFNDTLRTVVRQLPRNDASLTNVLGTESPQCNTVFEGEIILKNAGVDTLTSAQVFYSINSGPTQQIDWSGNLPPNASTGVAITDATVAAGPNSIFAYSSLPNGVPDENTANDTITRSFTMVTDGGLVILTLLTDLFPNETTWELFDENNNVVYSGGPYTQAEFVYTEEWCLASGCYTFTIYDSFGDGMSWAGVEGSYTITDADGQTLAMIQNPAFGTIEENNFCTEVECNLEVTITVEDVSEMGLSDGVIFLEAANGNPPYEYSINGGSTYTTLSVFPNLPAGDYNILVKDDLQCTVDTSATVNTTVSAKEQNLLTPTVKIAPNPVENTCNIQVANLTGAGPTIGVEIIDGAGRVLHTDRLGIYNGVYNGYVSLARLPAGLYFVRIREGQWNWLGKVVKE